MTDHDDITLTPDDITLDLHAFHVAQPRLTEFFAHDFSPPATRSASGGVGRSLIGRCPTTTQKRYHTLLHFETYAEPDDDHGLLIAPACAVLEAELCRLVADPIRTTPNLLDAAADLAFSSRGVVDNWRHGQPATLGTLVVLFLALRRGLEQNQSEILDFVSARFRPEFTPILADRRLATTLDRVRYQFRNPACHGKRIFDAADYERFVNLIVAARRLDKWDRTGPELAPPSADSGVLHHHLSHALGDARV